MESIIVETIFLLLIGQKARNSVCDWLIQLSDNSCPLSDIDGKWFYCRTKET